EFRGILNIELDGQKLITFIFFGLPDLDTYLALDKPLQQRIAVRYELESLTEKTTEEYVRYRLEVAGAKRDLFANDAYMLIHQYSEGIPRLINSISDNALLEGFLRRKDKIDGEIIREVVSDLKLIGLDGKPN
ncbi:MAG: hypothetical protein WAO55_09645, partial [Candidatus Manganitrophaceae bacterium]